MPSRTPDHPKAVIPRSVWGFGINSFFMEISNNLIHGVLPIYLLTALKLSISQIGIIEGIAEATNSVMLPAVLLT